ncbi:MAG: TlpA family protein disulfide reductase [bacterium]|nr:TlpA family protein disulfide reductase [bacterium]
MIRGLVLVMTVAVVACGGSAPTSLAVGDAAPSFTATAIDGGTMHLDELAGEPRILVFWATWCQLCLAEIPALEAIEAEYPGRVISVSLDEGGEDDVRRFLEARPLTYRVLLGDPELFACYDGLSIPHTVLLDRNLKVVSVHRGTVDRDTLERELASL